MPRIDWLGEAGRQAREYVVSPRDQGEALHAISTEVKALTKAVVGVGMELREANRIQRERDLRERDPEHQADGFGEEKI